MKLVSIKDLQVGFNPPMVQANEGAAIRWFGELCQKADTPMAKHPADFELYTIGEFDEYEGIKNLCEPKKIATASQFAEAK